MLGLEPLSWGFVWESGAGKSRRTLQGEQAFVSENRSGSCSLKRSDKKCVEVTSRRSDATVATGSRFCVAATRARACACVRACVCACVCM